MAQPIHLVVSRASSSAIRAIENAGGSIVCKYYTRTTLRALAKPHKLIGRLPPRDAVPVNKKDLCAYHAVTPIVKCFADPLLTVRLHQCTTLTRPTEGIWRIGYLISARQRCCPTQGRQPQSQLNLCFELPKAASRQSTYGHNL